MPVEPNGTHELFGNTQVGCFCFCYVLATWNKDPNTSIDPSRVTAFADKLGIEFALIHRKRKGKCLSSPDSMEILVGDVKDKVSFTSLSQHEILTFYVQSFLSCRSLFLSMT